MPTQANVDEIAEYLRSFKDGSRKHNQTEWHSNCGTAHCLAGWKAFDDYSKNNVPIDDWEQFDSYTSHSEILEEWLGTQNPEPYCTKTWGLTDLESYSLFDSHLTLDQMMAHLCKIAKDHDLIEPKF